MPKLNRYTFEVSHDKGKTRVSTMAKNVDVARGIIARTENCPNSAIRNVGDIIYLIEYEGGGYDGCFWEWNYAVVTVTHTVSKDGTPKIRKQFFDVFSSGRMGRKSVKALRGAMSLREKTDAYNVLDVDSISDFVNNSAISNVKDCSLWLSDNLGIEIPLECPICEENISAQEMVLGDFQGAGGIEIEAHSWHCSGCNLSYECSNCREYDSTTCERAEIFVQEVEDVLGKYITANLCTTCYDDLSDDLKTAYNNQDVGDAKNQVTDLAFFNGHVLSAWFNFSADEDGEFEDNEATDCVNCKERYTLESYSHPQENKQCQANLINKV